MDNLCDKTFVKPVKNRNWKQINSRIIENSELSVNIIVALLKCVYNLNAYGIAYAFYFQFDVQLYPFIAVHYKTEMVFQNIVIVSVL